MSSLPSGTVTFVFTDIEGSTKLLQELGDEYADVARDHRRIVRERFADAGGTEIDTQGDAFFFSFPRARDAVRGAVDAQRALRDHDWPQGTQVRVRMGLHTGEPTLGDEGYLGMDVVRAARISSAGHGGQILALRDHAGARRERAAGRRQRARPRRRRSKDIQHEHIYELAVDGDRSSRR